MRRLLLIGLAVSLLFPSYTYSSESESSVSEEDILLFGEIPVVIAGSFFNMAKEKAPGTSVLISQKQIELAPISRLKHLLELYVPGVHVGVHERNMGLYGARGILTDNNSKTLFLLEGQNLNQRTHGYSVMLESPFFKDIRSVEIINGPGAIVHGSGALNGFVNLIPKNGTDNAGSFVSSEYGIREKLYKMEMGYGKSYGSNKDIFLYGGYANGEGYQPNNMYDYFTVAGAREIYRNNAKVQGFKPSWKIASYMNHDKFRLNVFMQELNPQHNSTEKKTDNDSNWHQEVLSVAPSYKFDISETDSIQLKGAMEMYDFGQERSRENFPTTPKVGGSEIHGEGKAIFKTTKFDNHLFAAGGLYGMRQFRSFNRFFGSNTDDAAGSVDAQWKEMGVFAEDVYKANEQITASLGARFDSVAYGEMLFTHGGFTPSSKSHFSPRVAVAYEVNPGLVFKTSYQEGFHYPDAVDFSDYGYFASKLSSLGYANVLSEPEPEVMQSYELSATKKIPDHKINVTTNLYFNKIKKLLMWHDYTVDEVGVAAWNAIMNDDGWLGTMMNAKSDEDIASLGGEITVGWMTTDTTKLNVSYGYSVPNGISEQANNDLGLTNADRNAWQRFSSHIVKSDFTAYFMKNRLAWNVSGIYESSVEATTYGDVPGKNYAADPRIEVGTTINYDLNSNLSLKLVGRNIFGNQTPPASYYTNRPWRGNLGVSDNFYYLGLNWKV